MLLACLAVDMLSFAADDSRLWLWEGCSIGLAVATVIWGNLKSKILLSVSIMAKMVHITCLIWRCHGSEQKKFRVKAQEVACCRHGFNVALIERQV